MVTKILLTGASGNIGFLVFQELLRRNDNYKVRILVLGSRSEQQLFNPYKNKVDIIWGDLRDTKTVNAAVYGVDVVIHLGAIIPPMADEKPLLAEQVNVTGTQNIVNAIKLQDKPVKLIFSSSISVYGDRVNDPWIKVGDPLVPSMGDEYAVTKIKAENIVRSSDIQYTIFRLSAITNPRYKFTPIFFHVPLETSMEWCSADDVAKCLTNAISSKEIWGKTYNLGGGEKWRITYHDFVEIALKTFGIDPAVLKDELFATKDFHCGFYADGHQLNDLLHFQNGSIDKYFRELESNISMIQKVFYRILPNYFIQKYFERMSEPYQIMKTGNQELSIRES